jgi:hypothetical protein
MTREMHESFVREEAATPPSERSFGILIGAVLGLLALLNWWHAGHAWIWLVAVAALFLIAAYVLPAVLKPLNRAWFKLGLLMHAVVSPIVMGALFYGAVWPTGLVMRALGRDLLRLNRAPEAETYWIHRRPPGPSAESMKDQF